MRTNGEPAWEQVRAHLVTVVRRRLGEPAAVDDVVQDVLLRLVRSGWDGSGVDSVPAWLTRVATNAVIDHVRARGRVPTVPLRGEPSVRGGTDAGPYSGGSGGGGSGGGGSGGGGEPEAALATLAHGLADMVDALPAPYAEAVRRVDLEGRSNASVAAELGLTVSGVKSRVQRGRAQLARAVRECCRVQLDARGGVLAWAPRRAVTACCD